MFSLIVVVEQHEYLYHRYCFRRSGTISSSGKRYVISMETISSLISLPNMSPSICLPNPGISSWLLLPPPLQANISRRTLIEGLNGVNRLARGEKILLTTDKTRKKLPTSDKKIN